jgi:hypothetical protein
MKPLRTYSRSSSLASRQQGLPEPTTLIGLAVPVGTSGRARTEAVTSHLLPDAPLGPASSLSGRSAMQRMKLAEVLGSDDPTPGDERREALERLRQRAAKAAVKDSMSEIVERLAEALPSVPSETTSLRQAVKQQRAPKRSRLAVSAGDSGWSDRVRAVAELANMVRNHPRGWSGVLSFAGVADVEVALERALIDLVSPVTLAELGPALGGNNAAPFAFACLGPTLGVLSDQERSVVERALTSRIAASAHEDAGVDATRLAWVLLDLPRQSPQQTLPVCLVLLLGWVFSESHSPRAPPPRAISTLLACLNVAQAQSGHLPLWGEGCLLDSPLERSSATSSIASHLSMTHRLHGFTLVQNLSADGEPPQPVIASTSAKRSGSLRIGANSRVKRPREESRIPPEPAEEDRGPPAWIECVGPRLKRFASVWSGTEALTKASAADALALASLHLLVRCTGSEFNPLLHVLPDVASVKKWGLPAELGAEEEADDATAPAAMASSQEAKRLIRESRAGLGGVASVLAQGARHLWSGADASDDGLVIAKLVMALKLVENCAFIAPGTQDALAQASATLVPISDATGWTWLPLGCVAAEGDADSQEVAWRVQESIGYVPGILVSVVAACNHALSVESCSAWWRWRLDLVSTLATKALVNLCNGCPSASFRAFSHPPPLPTQEMLLPLSISSSLKRPCDGLARLSWADQSRETLVSLAHKSSSDMCSNDWWGALAATESLLAVLPLAACMSLGSSRECVDTISLQCDHIIAAASFLLNVAESDPECALLLERVVLEAASVEVGNSPGKDVGEAARRCSVLSASELEGGVRVRRVVPLVSIVALSVRVLEAASTGSPRCGEIQLASSYLALLLAVIVSATASAAPREYPAIDQARRALPTSSHEETLGLGSVEPVLVVLRRFVSLQQAAGLAVQGDVDHVKLLIQSLGESWQEDASTGSPSRPSPLQARLKSSPSRHRPATSPSATREGEAIPSWLGPALSKAEAGAVISSSSWSPSKGSSPLRKSTPEHVKKALSFDDEERPIQPSSSVDSTGSRKVAPSSLLRNMLPRGIQRRAATASWRQDPSPSASSSVEVTSPYVPSVSSPTLPVKHVPEPCHIPSASSSVEVTSPYVPSVSSPTLPVKHVPEPCHIPSAVEATTPKDTPRQPTTLVEIDVSDSESSSPTSPKLERTQVSLPEVVRAPAVRTPVLVLSRRGKPSEPPTDAPASASHIADEILSPLSGPTRRRAVATYSRKR